MRLLTDHATNVANETLRVAVLDEPGAGNACHEYLVERVTSEIGPEENRTEAPMARISFQNGPIKESGVNGITHEVLLAIVVDRMRGFQAGQYACRENAIALTKLEEALMWLQRRTRARELRGVEGTHEK